jgi:hypothetical protein
MAAIDFPSNPTLNQIYVSDSGYAFQWDGTVWKNYYQPGVFGGQLRADLRDDLSPELGNHLDARDLNIDNVGIITAAYFYGSGANLTNLPPSGQILNEVTSSGTRSNQQTGTTEISFLSDDFNVVPLGNGQVRIESAGGGFASIYGISSGTYSTINFTGSGVTLSKVGSTITFGATLAGLTDTQSISSATDGQVLKYSSSLGKWVPGDDDTGAGTGQVGPDDFVEAAGYAYSSGYWSPTTNGAVTNLTGTSQLSAWIDGLNDVLGKLVPPEPPNVGGYVGISTASDSIDGIFRICTGFTATKTWTGTPYVTGSRPVRVRFSNGGKLLKVVPVGGDHPTYTDTNNKLRISNIGPGDSGTFGVFVTSNTSVNADAYVTFTSSNNNGSYGKGVAGNIITISNNQDAANYYNDATDSDRSINGRAITPGFYSIFDVDISLGNISNIPSGMNRVLLRQYATTLSSSIIATTQTASQTSDGESEIPGGWYENTNNLSAPAISFGTVNNPTGYTAVKSSGVDHLPASVAFSYTTNLSRLTGDIYNYSENPVTIDSGEICAGGPISYFNLGSSIPTQNLGVSSPVAYVYSNQVIANKFTRSSNPFGSHIVTSPFGSSSGTPTYSGTVLLYSGAETGVPDETSGTIETLIGNTFKRCGAGSGTDKPTMNTTGNSWNPNAAVAAYEAKIIGGRCGHDITNYSTGYFPSSSVNYSSHDASQYCQFEFVANSIQAFNLNITGTYNGLWVAIPNNSGSGPGGWMSGTTSGWNGWADCYIPFSGGRPGEGTLGGSTTSAPATGTTGIVRVNFGTSSTANSTGSQTVFIRFKFAYGQYITGLSIS